MKLKKYRPAPPHPILVPRHVVPLVSIVSLVCIVWLVSPPSLLFAAPMGNARAYRLGMLGRIDWEGSGVSTGKARAYYEPGQLFIFKR